MEPIQTADSTMSGKAPGAQDDGPGESGALVSLARLGVLSGGTLTERTNDVDLVLEKARGRLGCTYTLGFRDEAPADGRPRVVKVWPGPRGLRVVHAEVYVARTRAAVRESVLRAAYLAPSLYDDGSVRASFVPLRPLSDTVWRGLVAMSFRPLQPDVDFGYVLARGPDIVRRAWRDLRLEPVAGGSSTMPAVTFVDMLDVEAGPYALSAVVSESRDAPPRATKADIDVPRPPGDDAFLVGPLLGRRAGADLVVRGGSEEAVGSETSFLPLLTSRLERPEDLVALTTVCGREGSVLRIERRLVRESGEAVGILPDVEVTIPAEREERCESLVDVIPGGAFVDSGGYRFEARLDRRASRSAAVTIERVR